MNWNGERVLVTGGAGFVGSRVAHELVRQGAHVVILDDLFTGRRELLPDDAAFVHGSVCDADLVTKLVRASDYVFHLAARNIIISTTEPRKDMEVNVGGTFNVLDAACGSDVVRVVVVSSASVYGNAETYREWDPPKPTSPYAVSKLTGEHYATLFGSLYHVPVTILRYSNVYGPGQSPENPYCGVIGAFFAACLAGASLTIYGDGEQTRDYTYVDDTVRATLLAARSDRTVGKIYNIGTGLETSVKQLAAMVQRVAGRTIPFVTHVDKRDIDTIDRRVLDMAKLRDALGWAPSVPLASGLSRTYAWLQEMTP